MVQQPQAMMQPQPMQAMQLVPVAAAPAMPPVRLGFALEWLRIPLPYLRPVAVPAQPEAPAMVMMQAPMMAPPMVQAPPVQYASVPLTGTGLVPVHQVQAAPAVGSAAVGVCPPCPPAPTAAAIEEITRQMVEMRQAIERGALPKKASGPP
jgi:hypothetical protein